MMRMVLSTILVTASNFSYWQENPWKYFGNLYSIYRLFHSFFLSFFFVKEIINFLNIKILISLSAFCFIFQNV